MAIQRKVLFGDVEYEYRPDKRVDLWVAGFKIVVYKPYRAPYCKTETEVYVEPKIYMSTNSTIEMTLESFTNINRAVAMAIQILNKEVSNLIKPEMFNYGEEHVNINKCPFSPNKSRKSSDDVKHTINYGAGCIITEASGRKSLYLGRGVLYEWSGDRNTRWLTRVRDNSFEIYVDFGEVRDIYNIGTNRIKIDTKDGARCRVDNYMNKRKAISIDWHHYTRQLVYCEINSKQIYRIDLLE